MTDRAQLARALPPIARRAVEAHLTASPYAPRPLAEALDRPRGVFVTLWRGDDLRGCIGHIEPQHPRLSQEVATCAVLAASRDPRFPPVTRGEFDALALEVSVLTPTEPVTDLTALDPLRWGVVVSCGGRRGVLLPEVAGIDTVERQLGVALHKGGIRHDEPWQVERFEVLKFLEPTTSPPHPPVEP